MGPHGTKLELDREVLRAMYKVLQRKETHRLSPFSLSLLCWDTHSLYE